MECDVNSRHSTRPLPVGVGLRHLVGWDHKFDFLLAARKHRILATDETRICTDQIVVVFPNPCASATIRGWILMVREILLHRVLCTILCWVGYFRTTRIKSFFRELGK